MNGSSMTEIASVAGAARNVGGFHLKRKCH